MTRALLVERSSNQKTGPIATITISKQSCPDACPLKNGGGCYAESSPMHFMWDKITAGKLGTTWAKLCAQVAELPRGSTLRYGQAGDLPGTADKIDGPRLDRLVAAAKGLTVLAYSHKPVLGKDPVARSNRKAIQRAVAEGFLVNLSGNNPAHADQLADLGIAPVTCILPHDYHRDEKRDGTVSDFKDRIAALPTHTPAGRRIAICPATYTDTTCEDCQACSRMRGDTIIGFPVHGWWRRAEGSTKCNTSSSASV